MTSTPKVYVSWANEGGLFKGLYFAASILILVPVRLQLRHEADDSAKLARRKLVPAEMQASIEPLRRHSQAVTRTVQRRECRHLSMVIDCVKRKLINRVTELDSPHRRPNSLGMQPAWERRLCVAVLG
jgi:hypothetical protein